jgi:hypothetical protein
MVFLPARFIHNLFTLVKKFTYILVPVSLLFSAQLHAQIRGIRNPSGVNRPILNGNKTIGGNQTDSLAHRDKNEDSITIYFRYLDSTRQYRFDSSISDFTLRFPVPATNINLGNLGTASRSLLFSPPAKAGWDPGFLAFDIYKWTVEKARFFNTTRPYTELGYMLGSKTEQIIEVRHTRNITPGWNAAFEYRFISSPGFFQNQGSNIKNIQLTSWYQGKKKRYNNYFVLLGNKLLSSENGGIQNLADLKNTLVYKDRFEIPTVLGGNGLFSGNFFETNTSTGNRYKEFSALVRQQYDIGRKDSLITDSTVIPLFYPRLRLEHTISYNTLKYHYFDLPVVSDKKNNEPDSAFYHDHFNILINPGDSVELNDKWQTLLNDFSVYQFPDPKNLQQFIRVGAALQNLRGEFVNHSLKRSFYNVILHGEYRNKTRNRKWDFELFGNLYSAGLNAGDYTAHLNLKRFVGKRNDSYAELGFENINRSPSFLFDERSSFYLDVPKDFKKENNAHFFASLYTSRFGLKLTGDLYFITNYLYFRNFYQPEQFSSLFNVVRISAEKHFKLSKHWNWYAEVYVQQKTGAAPLHLPFIFTRNRIAFEGQFYRNLKLSTGLEIRYHTPYKADNYSPVLGQFFYQDSATIKNLPEVDGFVHFRIRSFTAFVRLENLNTAQVTKDGGFGWTNNSFSAPGYPYPGLQFRLGIWWSFVN